MSLATIFAWIIILGMFGSFIGVLGGTWLWLQISDWREQHSRTAAASPEPVRFREAA
jgi:hypothetical protein